MKYRIREERSTTKSVIPNVDADLQDFSTNSLSVCCNALLLTLDICKLVLIAALEGQKLAILSIITVVHVIAHISVFGWTLYTHSRHSISAINMSPSDEATSNTLSAVLLTFNFTLLCCGYVILLALYRHSVTTIFNKNIPSTLQNCLPSFAVHMILLRPLEALFRFVTAKFRVLPDVIVLGEVRCGTTTLCHHLSHSIPGCHAPFCLWKHPELDKKETFYFVGHYFGYVNPHYYSMCFPLKITRWFHETILRKAFFTFDGCSQFLTSPTAPYLIAKAYSAANQRPPILVVSVRNPVDQAISWWKYENTAILWAESMGLTEWNINLRSSSYPPTSFQKSIDFSLSKETETSYKFAELLFQHVNDKQDNMNDSSTSYFLPPWAMTWPSGQLSTFGRNGRYTTNINRYEKVFQKVFGEKGKIPFDLKIPNNKSKFQFVNVLPFEYLSNTSNVCYVLECLNKQIEARRFPSNPIRCANIQQPSNVHRNPGNIEMPHSLEVNSADELRLTNIFLDDNKELEELCEIQYNT